MRMVEKLARSICLTRAQAAGHTAIDWRGVPMDWQTYVDIAWRLYENDAAVALACLMGPTDAMCDAGKDAAPELYSYGKASDVFDAMIRAALLEGAP